MQSSTLFQTTPENLVELLRIAVREELINYQTPTAANSELELMNPTEACDFLNITKTTLWRWQKQEKINLYGTGGKRYYLKSELLNLLTLKK
jgi:hypothetical protein